MDVQVSSERARARSGLRSSFESQDIEPHAMRFTGSGGEYFRVWIVNVLLSILTLGLYTPWARRRTAQYFYGHTLVAGSPLEFTAQQRRMVVGFVVLLLLTVAYQLAVNTGQDTAVGLFILGGAALSPLIWGSAMRFRLANTRWRGLRLQFAASWREVYTASWPVFALALVWLGVFWGLQSLAPAAVVNEETGRKLPEVTAPLIGLVALGLLLTAGLLPFYVHSGPIQRFARVVSAPLHMADFAAGVVDSRTIVWYLGATILLLFISIRILEARRLR